MISLNLPFKMGMKFMKAQLESSSFGKQSDEENLENLRRPRTREIRKP